MSERLPAFPALPTRWAAGAGALVLALIATAVGGLLTLDSPASGAALSGYPRYSHGLRLTYVAALGFDAVVRDPDDARVLYVMVPHDPARGACSVIQPAARVVAQGPDAITVRLSGYEYLPAPNRSGSVGFSCYLAGRIGVPVRLASPLGGRQVLGAGNLRGTGPAATVLDPGDPPRPGWLPAGYRASSVWPVDAGAGRVVGERRYARGTDTLVVASGLASGLAAGLTDPGSAARVAGHPGRVTEYGPTQRCVVWSTGAGTGRTVCSYGSAPLPAAQLLRVADSLG
jgi:hypothetical protein